MTLKSLKFIILIVAFLFTVFEPMVWTSGYQKYMIVSILTSNSLKDNNISKMLNKKNKNTSYEKWVLVPNVTEEDDG